MNLFRFITSIFTSPSLSPAASSDLAFENPRPRPARRGRMHVTWMSSQLMPLAIVLEEGTRERPHVTDRDER